MKKLVRAIVSLALLAWLASRTDWARVGQTFATLRVEFWFLAVGVYLAAQGASASRWQALAEPLGFGRGFTRYLKHYFIGMCFNLLLPTSVGGDVVRAWYLDGGSGRKAAAFASVFIDRLSGLLVLLSLACIAVCLTPIVLPRWIPLFVWSATLCGVAGTLALPWLVRFLPRLQGLSRVLECYQGRPGLWIGTTGLSLLVQGTNVLVVWLLGIALGADVPAGYYWVFVPMVTLLTMLPVSLNGMGVREGGTVLFLTPLGVPESTGISLAFLWFAVFTAVSLVGAAVYLFDSSPRYEEPRHGPIGSDSDQGRAGQSAAAA